MGPVRAATLPAPPSDLGAPTAIPTTRSIPGAFVPVIARSCLAAQYYMYDNLPIGCQTVLENGITYDVCDGVYYQPYIYGGHTVYLVIPT